MRDSRSSYNAGYDFVLDPMLIISAKLLVHSDLRLKTSDAREALLIHPLPRERLEHVSEVPLNHSKPVEKLCSPGYLPVPLPRFQQWVSGFHAPETQLAQFAADVLAGAYIVSSPQT